MCRAIIVNSEMERFDWETANIMQIELMVIAKL